MSIELTGEQLSYFKKTIRDAKYRAARDGISWDVDLAFLLSILPPECPVLRAPWEWEAIEGGNPNKPSIDRIDSSRGYTKDNVVIVSWRVNDLKADASIKELKLIYEYYKSIAN